MNSINFDQLQKEIYETENYLQFTNPVNISQSLNDNQTKSNDIYGNEQSNTNEATSSSSKSDYNLSSNNRSGKYSNSTERENLINKLLMEHKMKMNKPTKGYLDEDTSSDRINIKISDSFENKNESDSNHNNDSNEDSSHLNLNFIAENHNEGVVEDDEEEEEEHTDDIIFYASDLAPVQLNQNSIGRVSDMIYTQHDIQNENSLLFQQKDDFYPDTLMEDYRNSHQNDERYYREDLMQTTTLEGPSPSHYSRVTQYDSNFYKDSYQADSIDNNSKSTDSLEFAVTKAWPQANDRTSSEEKKSSTFIQHHQSRHRDRGSYPPNRPRSASVTTSSNRSTSTSRPRTSTGKPPLHNKTTDSAPESNRYLKTRERLQQEAREEFKDTYKFQPTIYTKNNQTISSSTKQQQHSSNNQTSMAPSRSSMTQRIEELNRQRERKYAELRKQKKAMDDLAMAECTFTPELSKGTYEILKYKNESDPQARSYYNDTKSKPYLKASDRLYQEAEQRILQQKYIEQQVYDARMAEYTFQPDLKPHSLTSAMYDEINKMIPKQPIHERLSDMLREKKQYMHQLQSEVQKELDQKLTFHPKIDPRSRKIAEKKLIGDVSSSMSLGQRSKLYHLNSQQHSNPAVVLGFHKDVGSRLLDQGRVMAKHKQDLLNDRESEIAESLAQAKISKGSQKIVQNAGLDSSSFEDRLEIYRQKEKEKEKIRSAKINNTEKKWFKPNICEASNKIISDQRPDLLLETIEMKAYRLSLQSAKEIEDRRQKRAAELYGSISFAPKIDSISKALGRSHSIEELVYNKRGQQIKANICKKVEADKYQECTFQPQINELSKQLLEPSYHGEDEFYPRIHGYAEYVIPGFNRCPLQAMEQQSTLNMSRNNRSNNGRINMKEPEKMAQDIRIHLIEKEERRRSELIAKEINELRECTFQPNLDIANKYYSDAMISIDSPPAPVVIRGLGRYLELKQLSLKQKEDAIEREKEVFRVRNVDKYRRAEDGSTIVQSFKFHTTSPRHYSTSTELDSSNYNNNSNEGGGILQKPTYRNLYTDQLSTQPMNTLQAPIWTI